MRLSVWVNDTDVSDAVHATSLEITQSITDRSSQARLSFIQEATTSSGEIARYDEALYDVATYGVDVRELNEIAIIDRDTGVKQFAGTIRQLKPTRKRKGLVFIDVDCLDWTTLLDEAYVISATFTGQTDRAIIQALIATYQPQLTALTANIASTATLTSWTITEKTLRQALDELCEFTGAEYRVDYDRNLVYFLPSSIAAPWGLSSNPDNTTTFGIDALTEYSKDAIKIINRCTVLGGVLPGGQRLKVTYDDPISQAEYGVRPHTEVDDQLTVASVAMLRAQAIVAENAYPQESLSLRTTKDGLQVGQTLPVYHSTYLVNGNYLIRELTMKQISRTKTEYVLTLGEQPPDALRLLRQIEARSRRNTGTPTAVPADGTVTDASITLGGLTANVIGSVNAGAIIGTITAGQIGSVNAASISGVIQSTQIGTVNATSIQGAITADQIGSVNATTIEGVIISSQVADGLIDSLSKIAAPLRAIPSKATEPALPDPNYPVGSYYYNTTNGFFYQNSGAGWAVVPEGTAVAGKLEYYHIGSIKASKIVGLILAAQIENITAGQIIGALTAAQIGSVNASAITGSITAAQIATVNASAIQGTLTSGQIGTITASQITGTFTAGQIASVNASAITGTITSTQIGSVNAASVTIGLLQDSQIGNINAGKLTTGTLNAALVNVTNLNASNITTGSMSASRIGAGTISASISITSPTITGGSITGANYSIAGPPYTVSITGGGITVADASDINDLTGLTNVGIFGTRDGTPRFNLDYFNFGGRLVLRNSGGTGGIELNMGNVYLANGAIAGGASPLPATPEGYLFITVDGATRRIAFYR